MANLGQIAHDSGDTAGAAPLLRDALALQVELGHKREAAETMAMVGDIAGARGDHITAARLWGHEERSDERLDLAADYYKRPARIQALADTSTALGANAFRTTWDAGRSMTFEEAFALSLQVCS